MNLCFAALMVASSFAFCGASGFFQLQCTVANNGCRQNWNACTIAAFPFDSCLNGGSNTSIIVSNCSGTAMNRLPPHLTAKIYHGALCSGVPVAANFAVGACFLVGDLFVENMCSDSKLSLLPRSSGLPSVDGKFVFERDVTWRN
jgi:hypothetical protein